jgi:hypothetical protein
MMKPRTPTHILDEIAQQHTRNDIDLSSRILTRERKDKARIMKSKYVLSGVLAVVAIIVIMFSIPSVATAMKRLLGYIPGVGVVENNVPLRILNEPVQSKQTGTTITIKQGVVDTQHTILVYQVENIPASQINPEMQPLDMCHRLPILLLPDGSRLQGEIESGTSWVSGYGRRIVFPALPVDVNSIRLVFSCLEQTTLAVNTQKWEIALEFVIAPADLKAYPLVDLPTPMPAPTQQKTEEFSYASDLRLVVSHGEMDG